jgi:hypothetical protein
LRLSPCDAHGYYDYYLGSLVHNASRLGNVDDGEEVRYI